MVTLGEKGEEGGKEQSHLHKFPASSNQVGAQGKDARACPIARSLRAEAGRAGPSPIGFPLLTPFGPPNCPESRAGIIISLVQMRQLKPREAMRCTQSHVSSAAEPGIPRL